MAFEISDGGVLEPEALACVRTSAQQVGQEQAASATMGYDHGRLWALMQLLDDLAGSFPNRTQRLASGWCDVERIQPGALGNLGKPIAHFDVRESLPVAKTPLAQLGPQVQRKAQVRGEGLGGLTCAGEVAGPNLAYLGAFEAGSKLPGLLGPHLVEG